MTSLTTTAVHHKLNEHRWYLAECYKASFMPTPYSWSATRRVRFSMTIDANGRVSALRVVGTPLRNSAFRSCIRRELRTLTFPPPQTNGQPTTAAFEFELSFYTTYYQGIRAPVCEFSSF